MTIFGTIAISLMLLILYGTIGMLVTLIEGGVRDYQAGHIVEMRGKYQLAVIVVFWPLFVIKGILWLLVWPLTKAHKSFGSIRAVIANWWRAPVGVGKFFREAGLMLAGKR